jgi:hypothetical protein
MLPPTSGGARTEKTPTADYIPYAKSKSLGEQMIRAASNRLPTIVLRIAGVFSDWSELPPLASLIGRWAGRGPASRLVPGRGATGVPYLHRSDLVRLVRSCVAKEALLPRDEVFLASPEGAVLHRQLFDVIRRACGKIPGPIFIAPPLARIGLAASCALGSLVGRPPYEHPWMPRFVDRAWIADSSYTCSTLDWRCTQQDEVHTRWSDANPPVCDLAIKLRELGGNVRYKASYSPLTEKAASALFSSVCRIGGREGWFHSNWMWRLRGLIDRFLLGVGSARGRRNLSTLRINDVIDFWRVEDLRDDALLFLRAEMKLPGMAYLQFQVAPQGARRHLCVEASFQPRGLFGKVY